MFGGGLCSARPTVLRCVWHLITQAFTAVSHLDDGGPTDAAQSAAANCLDAVSSQLPALCDAVLHGKYMAAGEAGAEPAFHPRFLPEVRAVGFDALMCVCTVAMHVSRTLPKVKSTKAKGKKGKGKGATAGPSASAGETKLRGALKALVQAVVKDTAPLISALSDKADRPKSKPDGSVFAGFRAAACSHDAAGGDDAAAVRSRVFAAVQGAWADAMDQLADVCKDRVALVRAINVK